MGITDSARYARQLQLPEIGPEGQRLLAQTSVAVVGAGGLGAPIPVSYTHLDVYKRQHLRYARHGDADRSRCQECYPTGGLCQRSSWRRLARGPVSYTHLSFRFSQGGVLTSIGN